MNRIALLVLGVVAISTSTFAQASLDNETIVLAAPASLREAATIIKWKPDYTYDTVKKGTNQIVCYDLSGFPQQPAFSVACTTLGNLDRAAQNLKFEALGDKAKTQAALHAAEKDGSRVKPQFGSMWLHLRGTDKEHARAHQTIAVPGATTATMGLPEKGGNGSVWIMDAGTTTAHLMIPGE